MNQNCWIKKITLNIKRSCQIKSREEREAESERPRQRQTDRQTDRQTNRERQRQRQRQRDRQRQRQTDRQTDRQTERERERERELLLCANSIIDHLFHSYMHSDSYRNEMKMLAINITSVY